MFLSLLLALYSTRTNAIYLPQKAELGRHVNEQRMPEWLVALLNKGGAVCSEGTYFISFLIWLRPPIQLLTVIRHHPSPTTAA